MKTSTGINYNSLFAHTTAADGILRLHLAVPMDITLNAEWFTVAIPHIKERISTEKKPAATYEKCIEQIALHSDHLAKAYTKLFETYQYATTPQTRNGHSVVVVDIARTDMLSAIKEDKMLRAMCAMYIGEDAAADYVLPDDRDQLISATVAAIRDSKKW